MKVFYFVCALIVGIQAGTIPSYIKICKRNDPAVVKCIKTSIEAIRPKLMSGIPEIGVPAIEPITLEKIEIIPASNGIKAELKNVVVHGAGNFQLTKLKLDIPKQTYHFGIKIPELKLSGDYDIDATIVGTPIRGKGKFTADATKIEGYGILRGEIAQGKGHSYLKFNALDLALKIDDYNLNFDNLFNGDKVLSQALQDLIRDNKKQLLENSIPFIQTRLSDFFVDAANKVTENLDYEEVFPEK